MVRRAQRFSGCGIELRPEHRDRVLVQRPDVPFLQLPSEDVLEGGPAFQQLLDRVRRDYAVTMHGAAMSLGWDQPLDRRVLARLVRMVDRIQPALVGESLALRSSDPGSARRPLPLDEEGVSSVAGKIRQVEEALGRTLLVSNVTSFLHGPGTRLSEADFLVAVMEESGCDLLLDLASLHASSRNLDFSPDEALDLLPPDRVRQLRVAGVEDLGSVVVDTRDRPVSEPVWTLYRQAVERFGPLPTVVDWKENVPPLQVLLADVARAGSILAKAPSPDEQPRPGGRPRAKSPSSEELPVIG